ncbi:uncharacterized protein LOC117618956 isoform X1 [Prunus dulcis]|uniref:uncharacterized protein LOC117618956 isoform X1 n=1 Tax=Prunus dulcis TaxID=3755 RepID=UPI001482CD17|nr:uncharacterized protein LOC117618956 isoform X1 [Prunus dulcis]XP_034204638.1 uncharacterized protein LOC117618956 isoform X1 [Prunus dulcis]XP_034204639.1 uncharacterized protein LOC117618956 isoform X1 [Prunus dulcis]
MLGTIVVDIFFTNFSSVICFFNFQGLNDNRLYSGAVAGAREALICGVSSLCMSLNWKKDVSYESDKKDAVGVSLPLTYAAVKSIQEEVFPKSCLLNFEIPSSPWTNKVLSSIALWLFTAAKAPKDTLDLYLHGHGKFETLGALGISCMLALLGMLWIFCWDCFQRILL